MSVLGGLIFGVGFALLGYCPGTLAGALGQGHLDALFDGAVGTVAGSWLFALAYPRLRRSVLLWGDLGTLTHAGMVEGEPLGRHRAAGYPSDDLPPDAGSGGAVGLVAASF